MLPHLTVISAFNYSSQFPIRYLDWLRIKFLKTCDFKALCKHKTSNLPFALRSECCEAIIAPLLPKRQKASIFCSKTLPHHNRLLINIHWSGFDITLEEEISNITQKFAHSHSWKHNIFPLWLTMIYPSGVGTEIAATTKTWDKKPPQIH